MKISIPFFKDLLSLLKIFPMKIILINRAPPTLITIPAEAVYIFNLYLVAETAVYGTNLIQQINLLDPKYVWNDEFVIEMFCMIFGEKYEFDKDAIRKMWKEDKKIKAVKHKLRVHLDAIHRFRAMINSFKAAIINWIENFLKQFGIFPWINLFSVCTETPLFKKTRR